MRSSLFAALLTLYLPRVGADGNDWVNPNFVLQKTGMPSAQARIISFAKSTASSGPWTASGGTTVLPPNGDKRDYLSWAPYHWPDCNWCTGGRAHIATGGNRTDSSDTRNTTDPDAPGGRTHNDANGGGGNGDQDGDHGDENDDDDIAVVEPTEVQIPLPISSLLPKFKKRMRRVRRSTYAEESVIFISVNKHTSTLSKRVPQDLVVPDVSPLTETIIPGSRPTTTTDYFAKGSTGVQNAKKTTSPAGGKTSTQHVAATKTAGGGGSDCTPSPTKSLTPSATWTTCKYVVRDGKANPDVRNIPGVSNVADAAQSILYNAAAAVLSGSQDYSKTAVQFIQTFFLDSKDGMHPRVAFGQLIRGPGAQTGQYLGVIDLRGMIKVANAIQIMRAAKAPAWTNTLDTQMVNWASQYVKWMQTDSLGQKALSAPNNHGSFATNQLAAINILLQNPTDAGAALKSYFASQFLDQIAASGEQPFEAVRTRPFHYRCFNLEAMITNAKLGDQLGLNFWTAKSKYGATIKDALDFVLAKGPGNEDESDIFPLVTAIAAAYGDSNNKYASYLRQKDSRYQVSAYYFYNQPGALTKSPAAAKSKSEQTGFDLGQDADNMVQSVRAPQRPTPTSLPVATPTIPFECPAAFATAAEVQLDDGVWVTCDQLKYLYGYAKDTAGSVQRAD